MTQEEKRTEPEPQTQRNTNNHWLLWTLVAVFIVGSITVMMVADYIFAPALIDPATLPEAVGK